MRHKIVGDKLSSIKDLVGEYPLHRALASFFGDKEVKEFFNREVDQPNGWKIGDVVRIRKP